MESVSYLTASLRASLYQVWERLKEAHPVKQWWEEPDKTKTGTQFICFTGAKVQILTQKARVQTLTQKALQQKTVFFEVIETHKN